MNGDKHLPSSGREFERGFGWTLLLSAAAHIAILGALVVVPGFVLRPQPKLVSYTTVDLVDPNKIGGTNLIQGSKGKAPAPPKVEPAKAKEEPPPPPPPEEAKAEPPPPEPPKPEVKEEPPAPPKEQAKPPEPPKPPDEQAVALDKRTDPTPTPVQVAKIPPTVPPAPPTNEPKPEVPTAKPTSKPTTKPTQVAQLTPTSAPKAVAQAKTTPTAVKAAKAGATPTKGAAQAVAKAQLSPGAKPNTTPGKAGGTAAAAKTTPGAADAKGRDDKIAAAIKRIEQQAGQRGGGSGTEPGDTPGGPVSIGPGEGVGGEVRDLAFIMYTNRLEAMIKEKWVWAGSDKTLKADIAFNITPSGEVLNVRTVVSSGDANYDRRAETAVRAASPFPSPPEQYQEEFERDGFVYTFEPN